MNQQAKDGLCHLLEKTPKDRRSKMKVEKKIMETTQNITTKCSFHVKKKDTYLGIARGNEKGSPPL
jgi:hypothetical protein